MFYPDFTFASLAIDYLKSKKGKDDSAMCTKRTIDGRYLYSVVPIVHMAKIPVEDEQKIIGYLLQGKTTREVGKILGRSSSTVSAVAKRNDLDLVELARSRLKRATLVSKYAQAERRASVAAKILERGEGILDDTWGPRDFRDVSVGLAVGLDKMRQELPGDENKGGEILELVEILRAGAIVDDQEEGDS